MSFLFRQLSILVSIYLPFMCGISCIINRKGHSIDRDRLSQMTDIITYRGPNGYGYNYKGQVGLGHRRLAIIDLSEGGNQPFIDRELVLIYNGEIYNYLEIKEELQKLGVHFETKTDTEVLLKAYRQWGEDCLHRFNGMWAFVIHNTAKKTVFASRDRFGIKPLYYCIDEKEILFASEIKQIHRVKNLTLNKPILYEFLEDGYLNHTTDTFFNEVHELEKGHVFQYCCNSNTFSTTKYYSLEAITHKDLKIGYEEACVEFKRLFQSSVALRLRSDVKMGLSLSGGLDSSSITAMVSQSINNFPTFSVVFDQQNISERKYVDAAVHMYGVKNSSIQPSFEDLKSNLERTIWHMDQPISSTSFVMDHILLKHQQDKGVVVTLSGQGADEVLAGYDAFQGVRIKELFAERSLFNAVTTTTKAALHMPDRFVAKLKAKVGSTENTIINPLLSFPKKAFAERTVRDLSLRYMDNVGLGLLLHYVDRNSMAASIESRLPFLDHRLVEFCLRLPSAYKIDQNITKRVLRDGLKDVLPKAIRNRRDKLGYHTPQRQWYSKNLQHTVDSITTSRLSSLINNRYLNSLKGSISEQDTATLTRLHSAALWMDIFDVNIG